MRTISLFRNISRNTNIRNVKNSLRWLSSTSAVEETKEQMFYDTIIIGAGKNIDYFY